MLVWVMSDMRSQSDLDDLYREGALGTNAGTVNACQLSNQTDRVDCLGPLRSPAGINPLTTKRGHPLAGLKSRLKANSRLCLQLHQNPPALQPCPRALSFPSTGRAGIDDTQAR